MNPALNPKAKARSGGASATSPTILLVDDDPAVRQMVGRVLREEGYQVLKAANGTEALDLARSHRIDLALLDLSMPGQGGWDVFERLTTRDPLLAVIIILPPSPNSSSLRCPRAWARCWRSRSISRRCS